MKIHPVGADLFHADRHTDKHDKSSSHFMQFCQCAKRILTFTLRFPHQTLYVTLLSPIRATYTSHLILFDLIT